MKTSYWLLILFVVGVLAHAWGIDRGGLGMLQATREMERKQDEARANVAKLKVAIAASECQRAKEETLQTLRDAERENRVMKSALRELFQGVNFSSNLTIHWNRPRLRPMTGILLFNADAMPVGRFSDRHRFIFPHHAGRGEKAVFLGECEVGVTVFCLTGNFAGQVLTFRPWQRFDRQGALVYHF